MEDRRVAMSGAHISESAGLDLDKIRDEGHACLRGFLYRYIPRSGITNEANADKTATKYLGLDPHESLKLESRILQTPS